jgi:uncharacterized protein with HEPN domain
VNPDRDFLLDIAELIETIRRHQPESQEELMGDEVLLAAVIHWVQTIGEAANAISENLGSRHPEVPWRQIVDMRNLLAHGYRFVDPAIVWQVVVRDPRRIGGGRVIGPIKARSACGQLVPNRLTYLPVFQPRGDTASARSPQLHYKPCSGAPFPVCWVSRIWGHVHYRSTNLCAGPGHD